MRCLTIAVALLALALPAVAEEEPSLTPELGADAVLEAFEAKDDAAFKALAEKDEPDPWLVADELTRRARPEAALALARASSDKDVQTLASYVEAQRGKEDETAARRALEAQVAALERGDFEAALAAAEGLGEGKATVARVRLQHGVGLALRALGRSEACVPALVAVADAAESIGWLRRVSDALHHAGLSAWERADWRGALGIWTRLLALDEEREDRGRQVDTLNRLGMAHHGFGDLPKALSFWERAFTLAEQVGDRSAAAAVLGNIGSVQQRLGDLAKALSLYEQALARQEEVGEQALAATTLRNIGLIHATRGRYDEALDCYERSRAIGAELGDRELVAHALVNIAHVHRSRGEPAKALPHVEEALRIFEELGNRAAVARTLGHVGDVYDNLTEWRKARAFYERSLAMLEEVGDRQGVAAALGGIGNVLRNTGELRRALPFLERALAIREQLGAPSGIHRALMNLGHVHHSLGEWEKALSLYERSLAIKEELGDRGGVAAALGNIGLAHFDRGDWLEAVSYYERVEQLDRELGQPMARGPMLTNRGYAYLRLGDYPRALAAFEECIALHEQRGARGDVASNLGNLGVVYEYMGDLPRALSLYERALRVLEDIGDRGGVCTRLVNIGALHNLLGDWPQALAYFSRAHALAQQIGAPRRVASALSGTGTVYVSLGDRQRALSSYESALAILEDLGDRHGEMGVRNNLAQVCQWLDEFQLASSHYERALALARGLGDREGEARTLANLGSLQVSLGRLEDALRLLERALMIFEELGSRFDVTVTLLRLGQTHRRLGNFDEAARFADRAQRMARRLRLRPFVVRAATELARVRLEAGDPARALMGAQQALRGTEGLLGGLGEEEGTLARELHSKVFEVGALAAARLEEPTELMTFLESGRAGALLESLGAGRAFRFADLPSELLDAEAAAKAKEARARHVLVKARATGERREVRKATTALDEAMEECREVAARIQREAKREAGLFYPRAAMLEEVQGWLEDDQALVLYASCLGEALAMVVTPDGERIVSLGAAGDLEAAIDAARVGVQSPAVRGPLPQGAEPSGEPNDGISSLRALVVDPLGLSEDVETVLVSPEGPLGYVPFGALFEGRNVAMTPSGTTHVLLMDEEREPGEGVLALGDPTYGEKVDPGAAEVYRGGAKLSALPATRDEALAVGDVTLLGDDASERKLREAISKQKRWRAVHLACHGLVDPDRPTLSSLALTATDEEDGFLTALEVLRMEIPADLAVLSACETAKGKVVKGEGIIGLTRAFMYAGAPRVLCSLWKVDDDATRALMEKFYELWNPNEGEGLPAAEALRKAQAHVRSQEKWAHPYYWAAWVLWGLP